MDEIRHAFIEQAGEIAAIVRTLGDEFQRLFSSRSRAGVSDTARPRAEKLWRIFEPKFEELVSRQLALDDRIRQPPQGCEHMAITIQSTIRTAEQIHLATQSREQLHSEDFLDFFPELCSTGKELGIQVEDALRAMKKDRYDAVFALGKSPAERLAAPVIKPSSEPCAGADPGGLASPDPFTTEELAKLAHVSKTRLLSTMSKSRTKDAETAKPPPPTIKSLGRRPAVYSYASIRPWLVSKWPGAYFPEDYPAARNALSNLA